jgi:nucleoside diphosphate kinase
VRRVRRDATRASRDELCLLMIKPECTPAQRALIRRALAEVVPDLEWSARIVDRDRIVEHYGEYVQRFGAEAVRRLEAHYVGRTVWVAIGNGRSGLCSRLKEVIGASDPPLAAVGTIRRRLCDDSFSSANAERRLCRSHVHSSRSDAEARREIAIWYEGARFDHGIWTQVCGSESPEIEPATPRSTSASARATGWAGPVSPVAGGGAMRCASHLTAKDVRETLVVYGDLLRRHRSRLNQLNVFPMPDRDTGDNMSLTVAAAVAAMNDAPQDMASTCAAIGSGSLRGARGNSGVILSQVLRRMTATFAEAERCHPELVACALVAASRGAYEAVMHPVEGTMLSVLREAADASQAVLPSDDVVQVLGAARDAARSSVDRTPQLLPLLDAAGVVDAGGAGLAMLFDAALHAVGGLPLPVEPVAVPGGTTRSALRSPLPVDAPGFEVALLLEATEAQVESFKSDWDALGESIVVVGDGMTWNCHIHCDDVGAAVAAGRAIGTVREVRVMPLVEAELWDRSGGTSDGHDRACGLDTRTT